MAVVWLGGIWLLLVFNEVYSIYPKLEKFRVSKDEAFKGCGSNKMLRWDDIQNSSNVESSVRSLLKPGDRAWLNDTAKLSLFVSYLGCFHKETVQKYYDKSFVGNGVYLCSNECRNRGRRFFGLRNETCFCVEEPTENINDSTTSCHTRCKTPSREWCGGGSWISIYRISDESELGEKKGKELAQCVLLQKSLTSSDKNKWMTESCLNRCQRCKYLCEKCIGSAVATGQNCTIAAGNYTEEDAANECKSKNLGTLIDGGKLKQSAGMLELNYTFWTGIFRTFLIEGPIQKPISDACVSTRKIFQSGNYSLKYVASPCSDKLSYICLHEDIDTSESSTNQISVTTRYFPVETCEVLPTWAIIAMVLVLLVVLVILGICQYKIRKTRASKTTLIQMNSDTCAEVGQYTEDSSSSKVAEATGQGSWEMPLELADVTGEDDHVMSHVEYVEDEGKYTEIDITSNDGPRNSDYQEGNNYNGLHNFVG